MTLFYKVSWDKYPDNKLGAFCKKCGIKYVVVSNIIIIVYFVSLTLNDASSNNVCVAPLKSQLRLNNTLMCDGDFFYIWCYSHIIILIVQKELKEIEEEIEKAHESITYVKGSQIRKKKFLEYVK